jgi:hypothetical protein
MDPEIEADDGVRACPHLASADGMVVGLGIRAAILDELLIGHDLRTGKTFSQNVGL